MDKVKFQALLNQEIEVMSQIALTEDLAGAENSDITAELVKEDRTATASLVTRQDAILCGKAWVEKVFEQLGSKVKITWLYQDGDKISANSEICQLTGNARALLTGERSAMNFLQSLSATATVTSIYQSKLEGTNCKLLDTRKTIPGMRFGQKYAVKCGGGVNHRLGLSDAYLIKENHILACGGIKEAIQTAQQSHPDKLLEIEVESLSELSQALDSGAQVVMLDNFTLKEMSEAVKLRDIHPNKAKLEASGNVSLETIKDIADTGIDFISVGALTKHIDAIDLSMRITLVDE